MTYISEDIMINNNKITECRFPETSCISHEATLANYYDSYKLIDFKQDLNPLEIYLLMVNSTPSWV